MRNSYRIVAMMFLMLPSMVMATEVETTRLPNGVEAWYVADDTLPVVHVVLAFEGAGYASDPADKHGLAQLTSSLLLEGAGEYDALAFQEALENHAIAIDAAVNADRMTITIHALKEHAVLAGELAAMALSQPHLDAADVERIKSAQQSTLQRASESASYRAGRQFAERAFSGHPYSNPALGDISGIGASDAEDMRRFIATYLTSGNLKVAVAGDVSGGAIREMLSPLVEALPKNDTGAVGVATISVRAQGVHVDDSVNVPQSTVLFAAPGIRRNDPEFYAAYLLLQVLGGDGLTSRLAREIRQNQGLVYSVSAGLEEMRGAALISGSLSTRNSTRDAAIDKVKEVFGAVYLNGVTSRECADAKTYVKGSFPLQMDSTSKITRMLISMQIFDLGKDYIEKRQGYFDAVSCSDINRAAKALLDPSRLLFVSVGGKPEPEPTP